MFGIVFFDSSGSAWISCPATYQDAQAFGPHGCARRVYMSDLGCVAEYGESDIAAARRAGRVIETDEWPIFVADLLAVEIGGYRSGVSGSDRPLTAGEAA